MKKFLAVILVLVLALSFAACANKPTEETDPGADAGEPIKLLYIAKNKADAYSNWCSIMLEQALKDNYPDVEYKVLDQQGDASKTESFLEQAVIEGYDVVIIDKTSSSQNCDDMIKSIMDEGIKVVAMNNRCDTSFIPYCGNNNILLGEVIGGYAAEKLPENAKVVVFQATPGNATSEDRWTGYQNAFKAAGRDDIEVLEIVNSEGYSKEIAVSKMEDLSQRFDQIDGIISVNDGMAIGAIEVLKADGRDISKIMAFGVDGLGDACNAIVAGQETGSVMQNAKDMAYGAVDLAMKYATGALDINTQVEVIEVDPFLITPENVQEVIARHKENGMM